MKAMMANDLQGMMALVARLATLVANMAEAIRQFNDPPENWQDVNMKAMATRAMLELAGQVVLTCDDYMTAAGELSGLVLNSLPALALHDELTRAGVPPLLEGNKPLDMTPRIHWMLACLADVRPSFPSAFKDLKDTMDFLKVPTAWPADHVARQYGAKSGADMSTGDRVIWLISRLLSERNDAGLILSGLAKELQEAEGDEGAPLGAILTEVKERITDRVLPMLQRVCRQEST